MPRTLREQLRKCKHFNGLMNRTCKAGVRYDDVRREPEPGEKGVQLPCLGNPGCLCDKLEMRTEAEIDERIAEIEKVTDGTMRARAAIVASIGPWEGKGNVGVVDCPVCGKAKALHFSRAALNGHIHAGCKTKGCVAWME